MAKNKPEFESVDDIKVKLKPFLGIKPGVYLTWLYGFAVCVILFLLLFLHGIRKNGTVVSINSMPDQAAVYVDGEYAGATPVSVFVPRGDRTIEIRRPFFDPDLQSYKIKGRLFGSLLFPRRMKIESKLDIEGLQALLQAQFTEQSGWALVEHFGATYSPEMVISNSIRAIYQAVGTESTVGNIESSISQSIYELLRYAISNISSEPLLGDWLRSLLLVSGGGNMLSPSSTLVALQNIINLKQDYRILGLLVPSIAVSEAAEEMVGSEWFSSFLADYRKTVQNIPGARPVYGQNVDVNGLVFSLVPAGRFSMGAFAQSDDRYVLPVAASSGEFYLLKTEVTRRMYRDFVEDDPFWDPDNLERLIDNGQVSADYLLDWDEEIDADIPVRYVSFYAAQAYCEWLNGNLPAAFRDYEVRLPSEIEWEWAASGTLNSETDAFGGDLDGPVAVPSSFISSAGSTMQNMKGNLWEWCDTWYYPAAYFLYSSESPAIDTSSSSPFDGVEMVVRGGSWANRPEDRISISSRGSQPPSWCTAFTGFRIVLSQAQ